jgi:hypothetical protein
MNVRRTTVDVWLALLAVVAPACSTGNEGREGREGNEGSRERTEDSAAQPLQLDALISTQQAKLLASDGAEFDTFGLSVAVSGNTAVVGASRDDDRGAEAGAAYIFVRAGATWTQQAKLTAADGGSNDNFGAAVAIVGETVLIGATSDDDVRSDAGAAYVFVRSGTTWTQQAKLLAADGASDDQLGISVALAGDTAVVGTTNDDDLGDRAGASYVFVRSGTTWSEQAKLTAADGAEADQLGIAVAVAGDTALVGAFGDDDRGRSAGSAYVFVRTGTSWSQQAKLLAADGNDIDELGISVAISGDTALVGAVFADDEQGAAYVYARDGAVWTQQAKLSAADGAPSDNFGNAVALEGDTALIGAPNDNDLGAASGSAYVFGRSGTTWSQQTKLTAADGTSVDLFGASVALSGETAVVGALGDDDLGSSSGSTYVYAPPQTNGGACVTSADCGSGFCTDGVCCDTACGDGDANDCQACSVAAGAAANGTCGPRATSSVCRAAGGSCDVAERCNGTSLSCPADVRVAAGTLCRAAGGACDVAETCTGTSAACPGDARTPAGTVCRAAVNSCDLVESCSGSASSCPGNAFKPDFSLCRGLFGLPGICLARICFL